MPNLAERIAARIAFVHARSVFRRFAASCEAFAATQQHVLTRVLRGLRGGAYLRDTGLTHVRTVEALRRAAPLTRFEDLRPYVERAMAGETAALFAPRNRVLMFATSSGTTALPKYIPVTPEFLRQYRRGWNTFGLKMLSDHPQAILRAILQSSSRYDETRTPAGIPCGAITGLLARAQKGIVRRFYVGTPEIAELRDAGAKYYTLMRFAVLRDVAFAITASPATFLRMAQTADEHAETLIRDVHDGTLNPRLVADEPLRRRLAARLRPDAARAQALAAARGADGRLRPRDYWKLEFLACWTGGTMGHYLERLAEWYGPRPVRDIGLLASEGRVSIPLDDGRPVGVLDPQSAVLEFIPVEHALDESPETCLPSEVEPGREYAVVLTNDAGLVRYRLDDIVRIHGFHGGAPLVEFIRRAGGVCSLAGEKLTESQIVAAVTNLRHINRLPEFDFLVVPEWGDPPRYRLLATSVEAVNLGHELDEILSELNLEYAERRKSLRLQCLSTQLIDPATLRQFDAARIAARGTSPDQYKRPALITSLKSVGYELIDRSPGTSARAVPASR